MIKQIPVNISCMGIDVEFSVPNSLGDPTVVMGIRKSGSSIFFKIVNAICKSAGLVNIDVGNKFFQKDVPANEWRKKPELATLLFGRNVYSGFRAAPLGLKGSDNWPRARKILMVRDPRDALVSQYYSTAYSHSLPSESSALVGGVRDTLKAKRASAIDSDIVSYVKSNMRPMCNTYRDYAKLLQDESYILFRYEDVIFEKRKWINDIAVALGVEISGAEVSTILSWADVVPVEEDKTQFVRKVTPGDHVNKLPKDIIAELNDLFAPEMTRYGYAL